MPKDSALRHYRKRECCKCHRLCWTTSVKVTDYICPPCKRAAGLPVSGASGGGYSSMTVTRIVITFGTCPTCQREDQELINDRCSECRWYDDKNDVDASLSARARRGKDGTNDFVRNENKT